MYSTGGLPYWGIQRYALLTHKVLRNGPYNDDTVNKISRLVAGFSVGMTQNPRVSVSTPHETKGLLRLQGLIVEIDLFKIFGPF